MLTLVILLLLVTVKCVEMSDTQANQARRAAKKETVYGDA